MEDLESPSEVTNKKLCLIDVFAYAKCVNWTMVESSMTTRIVITACEKSIIAHI